MGKLVELINDMVSSFGFRLNRKKISVDEVASFGRISLGHKSVFQSHKVLRTRQSNHHVAKGLFAFFTNTLEP